MRDYPIKVQDGMKFYDSAEGTLSRDHGYYSIYDNGNKDMDLEYVLERLQGKRVHIIVFVEE